MDHAHGGTNATLTVDLETQEIHGHEDGVIKFEIDQFKKHCLLNGIDDIGLTMEKASKIASFEEKAAAERPWI
jgi:3-isopropylmalate/(R)-2-methylmalate dehydratase small subunit